ncbi:hypothetical protein AX14_004321 [Amanita brunnescens Koide BX004]|nr:hypothetical protein AX14_004321 [Amanita brunnescens Koide BX004]
MSSQSPLLASEHLPPEGPALYEARRRLWLTPRPARTAPAPSPSSERRQRLDTYLATPGIAESDDGWKIVRGLWKGICSGKRLSDRISLRSMITIVQAAWIQDETWPKGAIVQSSDESTPK